MVVFDDLNELFNSFEKLGMPLPKWFVVIILILILFYIFIKLFGGIITGGKNILKTIIPHIYNRETMQFIDIRKNFVEHLIYEVQRLNREADWNDFHYTELEAEVEVDPSVDLAMHPSKNPIVWIPSLCQIVKKSIGRSTSLKIQKNLIRAIMSSNSRSFLVIGDPGSGKTVSLRHLFLEMADTCVSSKDKAAAVPIYLNLKHLDVKPDEVDANRIHDWVIEQLRADQDRTIQEFLDKNFEQMLKNGVFFFLFDSFDEIPAVMDAQEEQNVVRQYAEAMDSFLHSHHQCRGLVSSRPYRAPKIFMGQRMTIRSLSHKRIKKALYNYMGQEMVLADQLWQELVQSREDMMYIAQNPFYLGLLARYAKENQKLPDCHYDLFEHFVQTRAHTDAERLRHLGLTPAELVERASILAFAMTKTPHVGLEVNVDHVREVTNVLNETSGWDPNMVEPLLNALAYSKLGRISQEEPGNPGEFSFVHRRFHEYFCARYLRQNPNIAPFESLAADDRWREILVLLCEVLPREHLTRIFDTARSALTAGIKADSGSIEHRKAIETIRFLRDGFRSRIDDLPIDIREMCSKFIQRQLGSGYLFSWDKVSKKDDKRLLEFLRVNLGIDWAKDAIILKSKDNKTIRIFKNKNSAEITISEKQEKATLRIQDGRIYGLKVKKENGKLKIYESGNLLDQKRAIEGVSIADDESVHAIFESALTSDSAWLRETAIRSCRILRYIPQPIAEAMRRHIYRRYTELKIYHDYNSIYSVLFSSPPALHPFRSFSKILVYAMLFQILLYAGIFFYGLLFDIVILATFLGGLIIGILLLLYMSSSIRRVHRSQHHRISTFLKWKKSSNNSKSAEKQRQIDPRIKKSVKIEHRIFTNPWILLPIIFIYGSIFMPMVIYYADLSIGEFFRVFFLFTGFAILSIIFNVFLLGLVSDYPSGLSAWLLYPVRKLNMVLTGLTQFCKEWKNDLLSIFAFGCIILVYGGFLFLLIKAVDIAISQDFSIPNIYSEVGFILGTAVVISLLLVGLFILLMIIYLLVGLVKIFLNFKDILSDQIKFKKLSYFSNRRPSTATEAVQILQSFKSDVGKAKYIHALFKWLPVGTDPQVLIEEASKHQGAVCDELYKLAEIWEDSLQRNV